MSLDLVERSPTSGVRVEHLVRSIRVSSEHTPRRACDRTHSQEQIMRVSIDGVVETNGLSGHRMVDGVELTALTFNAERELNDSL